MYSCVLQNEAILNSTKNKSNMIYFSKFVFTLFIINSKWQKTYRRNE